MNDDRKKLDPRPDDPFFEVIGDGEWNATLGQQGHIENYLDGYIEAAIELVDVLFEKKLYGKRDTFVLPVLYNARHAVELNLKFAADSLGATGILKEDDRKPDHDIARYWQRLNDSSIADRELKGTSSASSRTSIAWLKSTATGRSYATTATGTTNPVLRSSLLSIFASCKRACMS